jgi:hypothetical protein
MDVVALFIKRDESLFREVIGRRSASLLSFPKSEVILLHPGSLI